MAWNRRWLGVGVVGLSGWLLSGCASDLPPYAMPLHSMADTISTPPTPSIARSQVGDGPAKLAQPIPQPNGPLLIQPPSNPPAPPPGLLDRPPGFAEKTPTVIAPPPPTGVLQTSASATRGTVRVRVRAWVNGHPIFDDEVMQAAGPDNMRRVYALPRSQQAEKMSELINNVLKQIVDQELMYQDACRKLEKINPKTLEKMKDYCEREFQKTVQKMRDQKLPEDQIREIEPTARRMMERNLISQEYARSRIMDILKQRVGMDEVREYYETHKNEFTTVDKVVWQDIFIPKGRDQSIEALKRFAEDLINKCRRPEDFDQLMVYNDGDSKLRNGEGLGQRLSGINPVTGKWVAGEIRPVELEQALSKLRDGEIGPVIAFPMGVHLIRATKREYAQQLPLDDKVQKVISKKLESQLADREYKRIVDELRLRAVIRMERETP